LISKAKIPRENISETTAAEVDESPCDKIQGCCPEKYIAVFNCRGGGENRFYLQMKKWEKPFMLEINTIPGPGVNQGQIPQTGKSNWVGV